MESVLDNSSNITVTTFNTACMWKIFSKLEKSPRERQKAIADYLIEKNHDIYCLQEDFTRSVRKYIKRRMSKYGYKCVHSKGRYGFLPLNGGITILSKHEIIESKWKIFNSLIGEDWFGNKGILYCRILYTTKEDIKILDVFGTHFQATPKLNIFKRSKIETQKKELEDMAKFINSCRKVGTYAYITMGDFNISSKSGMINDLIDTLCTSGTLRSDRTNEICSRTIEQDLKVSSTIWGRKLDYIFCTCTSLKQMYLTKVKEFTDNSIDFSDHYPVSITFR